MPEKPCVLDENVQFSLLEILDALKTEYESDIIEIDGATINLDELRNSIALCSTELPTTKIIRGTKKKAKELEKTEQAVEEAEEKEVSGKKRGPRQPSAYNKFIGDCRRGKEKGGQGLDFKTCVAKWKEKKAGTVGT